MVYWHSVSFIMASDIVMRVNPRVSSSLPKREVKYLIPFLSILTIASGFINLSVITVFSCEANV